MNTEKGGTNYPSVEKEQDNGLYKKDANAVC